MNLASHDLSSTAVLNLYLHLRSTFQMLFPTLINWGALQQTLSRRAFRFLFFLMPLLIRTTSNSNTSNINTNINDDHGER